MRKEIVYVVCLLLYILFNLTQIFVHTIPIVQRHVIAYILLAFGVYYCHISVRRMYNWGTSCICLFLYLLVYEIMNKKISFFDTLEFFFITNIVTTIFIRNRIKVDKKLLFIGIAFYLLNIIISLYEYKLKNNFFYHDMNPDANILTYARFRSTGIWGHPLYSSLIHGCSMILILMSNLNKKYKLILWFLGFFTIFLYDARASSLGVIVCSLAYLKNKKLIKRKYFIYIIAILIFFGAALSFLSSSEIGGKLFDSSTKKFNDAGSNARLVAFDILFDLKFKSLILGVQNQFEYAQRYYNVICAENSFVSMVLIMGFPVAMLFFYLQIKNLNRIMIFENYKIRIIFFSFIVISGLFNQALTNPYIWITIFILYILFCSNSKTHHYEKRNRDHNISRVS